MASEFFICFILISSYVLSISGEDTGFIGTVDPKSVGLGKPKTLSHFKFYWHEIFSGSNPTSVRVVPSLPKYNTTSTFGSIGILDNPLTAGPELYSKVVGSAEGLYAAASQSQLTLLVATNIALTQGKYNGSTITYLGRSPIAAKVRELPIVGGSGVFKFATGFVETRIIVFDPITRNNTVQIDAYVYY